MLRNSNRYKLRKLTVGLVSVCAGVLFMTSQKQEIHADTINNKAIQVNTPLQTTQKENITKAENPKPASNVNQNTNQNFVQNNNLNSNKVLPAKSQSSSVILQKTSQQTLTQEKLALQKADAPTAKQDTSLNNTQSINVKNVQQNSSSTAKELAESKAVSDSSSYAWNDTSDAAMIARGYHKTSAGWTKLQQGKDYDAVAKSSNIVMKKDGNIYSSLKMYLTDEGFFDPNITTTISKNDLVQGHKILIGSINLLNPDNRSMNYELSSWNPSQDIIKNSADGQKIGTVSINWGRDFHEADLFFNVTSNNKFASDLSFSLDTQCNIHKDNAGWTNYTGLIGTTNNNPFKTLFVTPKNKNLEVDMYPNSSANMSYSSVKSAPLPTYAWMSNNNMNNGWIYFNNNNNMTLSINPTDNKDYAYERVFRLYAPTGQKITPNNGFGGNIYAAPINLQNQIGNQSGVLNISGVTPKQFANNLTPQELLSESPSHSSITYSQQSDGSVLICFKYHTKDFKFNKDYFEYTIKRSYWWNIENPANKQQILDHTMQVYANNGYSPLQYAVSLLFLISNSDNKSYVVYENDVTPNVQKYNPSQITYNASGSSVDIRVYKQINVKFEDSQGNIFDPTTFTSTTGTDLTYNLKSPTDKTFNAATDIAIPDNVELDSSQPLSIHYGTVKDTNPDIIIKIKHKIVTATADSPVDYVKGASKDNLQKTAMRTITVNFPSGYTPDAKLISELNNYGTFSKVNGKWQLVQKGTFTRSIKVDETTGKLDGDYSNWDAHEDNGTFYISDDYGLAYQDDASIYQTVIPGYTESDDVSRSIILDAKPDDNIHNTVNYTADPRKAVYTFVDDDENGKQVGSTITVTGVTNQKGVATNLTVPTWYVLADGQTLPSTIDFGTSDPSAVTIHLKHDTRIVHDTDTKTRDYLIATNNGLKHFTYSDLNSDGTRTIHITFPVTDSLPVTGDNSITAFVNGVNELTKQNKATIDNQDNHKVTIVQRVDFVRDVQVDLVTGKVTYSQPTGAGNQDTSGADWWVAPHESGSYSEIKLPKIAGYTPHLETVTDRATGASYLAMLFVKNPVQPTKPVEPVKPTKPVSPTTPNKPAQPTKPVQPTTAPVSPTKPNKPNNSGSSVDFDNLVIPEAPAEPVELDNDLHLVNEKKLEKIIARRMHYLVSSSKNFSIRYNGKKRDIKHVK